MSARCGTVSDSTSDFDQQDVALSRGDDVGVFCPVQYLADLLGHHVALFDGAAKHERLLQEGNVHLAGLLQPWLAVDLHR